METIGTKISKIRKQKGLSQEELADLSKINLRTIQRIEKNENEPRTNNIYPSGVPGNQVHDGDYGNASTKYPNYIITEYGSPSRYTNTNYIKQEHNFLKKYF